MNNNTSWFQHQMSFFLETTAVSYLLLSYIGKSTRSHHNDLREKVNTVDTSKFGKISWNKISGRMTRSS